MIDSIDLELLWKTGAFIQSTNTGIIVILVYIVMQLVIYKTQKKKLWTWYLCRTFSKSHRLVNYLFGACLIANLFTPTAISTFLNRKAPRKWTCFNRKAPRKLYSAVHSSLCLLLVKRQRGLSETLPNAFPWDRIVYIYFWKDQTHKFNPSENCFCIKQCDILINRTRKIKHGSTMHWTI